MSPAYFDQAAATWDANPTRMGMSKAFAAAIEATVFVALLLPGGWLAVADLCAEDGSFHPDVAVPHHGFEPETLAAVFADAGLTGLAWRTVHKLERHGRRYPLFLLTGRRPDVIDATCVVTCSHALYELRGESRERALREMRRVVRPDGLVLIMEHEVPQRPFIRLLFRIRMLSMGSVDAREFIKGGLEPYERVFSRGSLSHSRSGKSRLMSCRK